MKIKNVIPAKTIMPRPIDPIKIFFLVSFSFNLVLNGIFIAGLVGLFAVISRKNQNSSGKITFYLDEIYYELEN